MTPENSRFVGESWDASVTSSRTRSCNVLRSGVGCVVERAVEEVVVVKVFGKGSPTCECPVAVGLVLIDENRGDVHTAA